MPERRPPADLGAREREVLIGLLDGLTIGAIATRLEITRTTAAQYVQAIYRKLGVTCRAHRSPPRQARRFASPGGEP